MQLTFCRSGYCFEAWGFSGSVFFFFGWGGVRALREIRGLLESKFRLSGLRFRVTPAL